MKSNSANILVVDDDPGNIALIGEVLHDQFQVKVANNGPRALELATISPQPDLILLDVMMPQMDGYQVLEQLRASPDTHDIPVIFVTALDTDDNELSGFRLGAVDYITKPVMPQLLLARVNTHLELKAARDSLRNQNDWLEAEVHRRMQENDLIQLVSIRALAHLAETRDQETGNHILRTQAYVNSLARALCEHPDYAELLDDHSIEIITRSAPLHDIGKVGIPDHILQKPGPLTDSEWKVMQTHAELGAKAIELAELDIDQPVEFLTVAKEIARWHHERWDGSGYPDGLAGNDIPISARLMAIADVFDALITERVYKPAMSPENARIIILKSRGSHFDPMLVDTFDSVFDDFKNIALRYRDPPETG
ncbi:HD-GYP domain-containing protein [Pseudohongiella spirulinae]|uniref:Transcriptional regulator n=1 Tax=Pseudohongiella spirulinae TaxID=1249552 RepID=A0A0S2KHM3_9GAMM|nr:two-component system response regulator [Pseudohongiella spirulinae]ALO47471.1 transcriptional regulator [Pseudohongiella spirulinae]